MKRRMGMAAAVGALAMTVGLSAAPFVLATTFAVGAASAATISYENAEATPRMELVLDDSVGPDALRFSLSTLVGTADFLGLGFNTSGGNLSIADFTFVSATRADDAAITPALELFGNNTGSQTDCGPGCNFGGAGSAEDFDYILRIGSNGGGDGGNNFVKSVVFDLATLGNLGSNPFSQFAVRAQSTTGSSTSIKTDLVEVPSPVPLPAGGLLLMGALGGLAALRRRRKAA